MEYEQVYSEEVEPQLNSAEDCHHHAMFIQGNLHFDNGRTYVFKDDF